MIFIIGGYSQGKRELAINNYGESNIVCEEINSLIEAGLSVDEAYEKLMFEVAKKPEAVLVGTEVSNGIVPVDKKTRQNRDKIGQLQILIAQKADIVIRVVCGIGQRIK